MEARMSRMGKRTRVASHRALVTLVAAVGVAVVFGVGQAAAVTTVRVSVSSTGAQGNGASVFDAISTGGRFVLFDSWATNLVPGDTNGLRDVFLRDRLLGRTTRISVGPGGRQANAPSHGVAVSSDGRVVLFESRATNLTDRADRNGNVDVFVRNRHRGRTVWVSVRPDGGQFFDSLPYGGLMAGGISDNGRWVAFGESASPWPGSLGLRTFVRDRATHMTRRVTTCRRCDGGELPAALSGNGRWLTVRWLDDKGPNTTELAIHDRWSGRTKTIKTPVLRFYGPSAVTPDAHYLVTSSPTEEVDGEDLMRWNHVTNRTRLLLTNHAGESYAVAGVSENGRDVLFVTYQPDLVPGDTNRVNDLFRLDTATKSITRLSLTPSGGELDNRVGQPQWDAMVVNTGMLSADGRWAAFTTAARAVPDDTNEARDVFLRGPLT